MKFKIAVGAAVVLFIAVVVLAALLINTQRPFMKLSTPKTDTDKISYSIGLSIGKSFAQQNMIIDIKTLNQGIEDGVKGNKTLMTEEEMKEAMNTLRKQLGDARVKQMKEVAEKNEKEGKAFLEENKKKPGVTTLPSGLQYEVIKTGTGKKPKPADTVVTHYRGTMIDGKEFDSSYSRGEPATFQVQAVIKGWTEALQLMNVGSKWKLYIPASLAYEERGAGEVIGPNATLVFEIELLDIK